MLKEVANRVPKAKRGQIVNRFVPYGTSVCGTPLEVYIPPAREHPLLIMAGHHGDEPETTAVLSAALRAISADQLHCAVILAANPDGLARGTRANARGVDLNRNFPTQNWQPEPVLHCWYDNEPKGVELSTGSRPGSEPETTALLELVQTLSPKAIVSLHSRLGCVDDPDFTPLAHWLSKATLLPLVPDIGYPTPGSFGSWAIEHKLLLITLELPDESILSLRKRLCPALEILLTEPDNVLQGKA